MKKGISFFIGLGLLVGGLAVPTMPVYAEASPTSCEGLENCVEITSTAEFTEAVTNEALNVIVTGSFDLTADLRTKNDMNLYLGEYTITSDGFSIINEEGSLAIYGGENGKIVETGGYWAPLYVYNGTTLYGGSIEAAGLAVSSYGQDDERVANFVMEGGKITITNEETTGAGVIVSHGGKMTLAGGEISYPGAYQAISVDEGELTMNSGKVTATGDKAYGIVTWNDSSFTMNGGSVTTKSVALGGNGTINEESGSYGANTVWNLNAGTLTSTAGHAIYQPQKNAQTTIGDGMVINGYEVGIEARAGSLTIEGGTISSNASVEYTSTPNGNGTTTTGAAVAIAQHTTRLDLSVLVSGGTFTGPVAFSETNPQQNGEDDIVKVETAITGGIFTATNGDPIVVSEDVEKFISGGEFNKLPDFDYITEGYEIYDKGANGPYFVDEVTTLPEYTKVNLLPGEEYTFENDATMWKYATMSLGSSEILSGENWTITGETAGETIVNINLHNRINPQERIVDVEVLSLTPEVEKVVINDGSEVEEIEDSALESYISEQLEKYLNGEEIDTKIEFGENVNKDFVKEYLLAGYDLVAIIYNDSFEIEDEDDQEFVNNFFGDQLEENDTPFALSMAGIAINFVKDDDSEYVGIINEVSEPVALEFAIPEEYLTAPKGYTRKFFVINGHFTGDYDATTSAPIYEYIRTEAKVVDGKLVIDNYKFSTFLVVYQDEQDVTAPDTGVFTKSDDSAIESKVKTSVILVSAVMMLLGARMMSLGFAGVTRAKNLEK